MAVDTPSAAALVAELPDWLKWGANVALIIFAMVAGPLVVRAGRKVEKERDEEPFDADKFLDATPIRRLLVAVEAMSDNAKIQTVALKTISAAMTLQARQIDPKFEERQIEHDVFMRLTEERISREGRI